MLPHCSSAHTRHIPEAGYNHLYYHILYSQPYRQKNSSHIESILEITREVHDAWTARFADINLSAIICHRPSRRNKSAAIAPRLDDVLALGIARSRRTGRRLSIRVRRRRTSRLMSIVFLGILVIPVEAGLTASLRISLQSSLDLTSFQEVVDIQILIRRCTGQRHADVSRNDPSPSSRHYPICLW